MLLCLVSIYWENVYLYEEDIFMKKREDERERDVIFVHYETMKIIYI